MAASAEHVERPASGPPKMDQIESTRDPDTSDSEQAGQNQDPDPDEDEDEPPAPRDRKSVV